MLYIWENGVGFHNTVGQSTSTYFYIFHLDTVLYTGKWSRLPQYGWSIYINIFLHIPFRHNFIYMGKWSRLPDYRWSIDVCLFLYITFGHNVIYMGKWSRLPQYGWSIYINIFLYIPFRHSYIYRKVESVSRLRLVNLRLSISIYYIWTQCCINAASTLFIYSCVCPIELILAICLLSLCLTDPSIRSFRQLDCKEVLTKHLI